MTMRAKLVTRNIVRAKIAKLTFHCCFWHLDKDDK